MTTSFDRHTPPARPMSSAEWVRADLERKLDDGTFPPGGRLPSVDELSRLYGVGRSTIREAISALKATGRLAVRQGGGTFALPPQDAPPHPASLMPDAWPDRAAALQSLLEVRRVLETGCAALAAEKRTADDLAAMESLLAEMADKLDDREAGERLDVKFHLAVAAAAHNETLAEMMRSISERLHDGMRDTRALWLFAERSSAGRLLAEHRAIYEAVRDGDAETARSLMEEHLAKVARVLRNRE
jgi:GntR family transcriptional repressor for pyruvate dehydrogenase complex